MKAQNQEEEGEKGGGGGIPAPTVKSLIAGAPATVGEESTPVVMENTVVASPTVATENRTTVAAAQENQATTPAISMETQSSAPVVSPSWSAVTAPTRSPASVVENTLPVSIIIADWVIITANPTCSQDKDPKLCVNQDCENVAVFIEDRGPRYCSNDCVVNHCRSDTTRDWGQPMMADEGLLKKVVSFIVSCPLQDSTVLSNNDRKMSFFPSLSLSLSLYRRAFDFYTGKKIQV